MTQTSIETAIKIFLLALVVTFGYTVYKVLTQMGFF